MKQQMKIQQFCPQRSLLLTILNIAVVWSLPPGPPKFGTYAVVSWIKLPNASKEIWEVGWVTNSPLSSASACFSNTHSQKLLRSSLIFLFLQCTHWAQHDIFALLVLFSILFQHSSNYYCIFILIRQEAALLVLTFCQYNQAWHKHQSKSFFQNHAEEYMTFHANQLSQFWVACTWSNPALIFPSGYLLLKCTHMYKNRIL